MKKTYLIAVADEQLVQLFSSRITAETKAEAEKQATAAGDLKVLDTTLVIGDTIIDDRMNLHDLRGNSYSPTISYEIMETGYPDWMTAEEMQQAEEWSKEIPVRKYRILAHAEEITIENGKEVSRVLGNDFLVGEYETLAAVREIMQEIAD